MSTPYFNGPLAKLVRSYLVPLPPDPWSRDVDASVRDETAIPLCVDCLYPQEERRSFCPHCDFPVGDFVPLNPYLQIFALGNILRKGVMGPPESRIGVQLFLFTIPLSHFPIILIPFYWFGMFRRAQGKPLCIERRRPLEFEETT